MNEDLAKIAQDLGKEELRRIRDAKLREIQKAWEDLFFIGVTPGLYKKHPEDIDYKSFEDSFKQAFEQIRAEGQVSETGSGILPGHMDTLLSLDYVPPQDWKEMAVQLIIMKDYYKTSNFILTIEMRLDLTFCKLIGAIKELRTVIQLKGSRELLRTKRSTKSLKNKQEKLISIVYDLYYRSNKIKSGNKLNFVAKVISKEFENALNKGELPKGISVPSLTSIREILMNDPKLKKEFVKEGRFWIIRT